MRCFLKTSFIPFRWSLKSVEEWIWFSKFALSFWNERFVHFSRMDSCIRLDLGQWIGGIVSNYRFRPSTIIPYPLIPSRILLHIESFNCIAANFLLERIRIFKISLSNFSFGRLSRSTFQGGGTSSNFRLEFVFDQWFETKSSRTNYFPRFRGTGKDSSISRRTAIFCGSEKKKIRSPSFQNVSECGASASLASDHANDPSFRVTDAPRVGIICSLD